jgi:CheY-like chemotaxis protein
MKHFLLVDDDEISNFIHKRVILSADPDAVVTEIQSSVQAIAFLNERVKSGEALPDFLFIDINMPELNGFDILQEIQKTMESHLPNMKVYMVSSSLYDRDKERAMQFSFVSGFIEKPLSKQGILNMIRDIS